MERFCIEVKEKEKECLSLQGNASEFIGDAHNLEAVLSANVVPSLSSLVKPLLPICLNPIWCSSLLLMNIMWSL